MYYPGKREPYGAYGADRGVQRVGDNVPGVRWPWLWSLKGFVYLGIFFFLVGVSLGSCFGAEFSKVPGMYQVRLSTNEIGDVNAVIRPGRVHTLAALDCGEVQRVSREVFAEYRWFDFFSEAGCYAMATGSVVAALYAHKGASAYYTEVVLLEVRERPLDWMNMEIETGMTIAAAIGLLLAAAWVFRVVIRQLNEKDDV